MGIEASSVCVRSFTETIQEKEWAREQGVGKVYDQDVLHTSIVTCFEGGCIVLTLWDFS